MRVTFRVFVCEISPSIQFISTYLTTRKEQFEQDHLSVIITIILLDAVFAVAKINYLHLKNCIHMLTLGRIMFSSMN